MITIRTLCLVAVLPLAASAVGAAYDPEHLTAEDSKVNFTIQWARQLRGFKTLEDIQRKAKSTGEITERQGGADPSVSYHFRGFDGKHLGYMMVVVSQSGYVGVSITTDDQVSIVLNNQGAFNCEGRDSEATTIGDHCPK